MPGLSDLLHDVLEIILDQLTPPDVLQLSRINKRLNKFAVPHVLRDVRLGEIYTYPEGPLIPPPRRLTGLEQVASFASFVLSDPSRYAHHIRSLMLTRSMITHRCSVSTYSSGAFSRLRVSVPPLLAQIVGYARELRTLVAHDVGQWSPLVPGLVDAIAALERLDYLELHKPDWSHDAWGAVLSRTPSRPSEMVLEGRCELAPILEVLAPHAHTLRKLTIRGVILDSVPNGSLTWPCVTSLTLESVDVRGNDLSALFPNVRQVTLRYVYGSFLQDTGPLQWPSVDWFTVAVPTPMNLIITHVRRVDIDCESWEELKPLARMSPLVLSYSPGALSGTYSDDLASGAWCASVRFLRLMNVITREFYFNDTLMPHLQRLSSTPLRQTLRALSLRQHAGVESCNGGEVPPDPASWTSLAPKLLDLFPNLDYVGFEYAPRRPRNQLVAPHWYRQVRAEGTTGDDGTPTFEEVPQSEVSDLIWMLENMQRAQA